MKHRLVHCLALVACILVVTHATASDDLDCLVEGAKTQHVRTQPQNAVEQEIMQLERDSCADLVAGNIDPMIDRIISDRGLLFAAGGPIVNGREAQRGMFKEFLAAGYAIEFEPTDAFVSEAQDMAWAYGLYRLTLPDGGEDTGKYVSVWVKEDGAWKNVAEMRNSGI